MHAGFREDGATRGGVTRFDACARDLGRRARPDVWERGHSMSGKRRWDEVIQQVVNSRGELPWHVVALDRETWESLGTALVASVPGLHIAGAGGGMGAECPTHGRPHHQRRSPLELIVSSSRVCASHTFNSQHCCSTLRHQKEKTARICSTTQSPRETCQARFDEVLVPRSGTEHRSLQYSTIAFAPVLGARWPRGCRT